MRDPHAASQRPEPVDHSWRHPAEYMDGALPADEAAAEYRAASQLMVRAMNAALLFVAMAPNQRMALWQVAYAMGLPLCDGISMTDRAERLGFTRAAFSKGAKQIQRAMQLPPSQYMKDSESTASYADSRRKQLTAN